MAEFSLAGLLRLRRRQEDQAAGALLRARSRASELAAQRTGVREAMLGQDEEVGSIEALHAIAAARASTSSMLADLRTLQVDQDAEVERARAAHEKARAARKAIEKLESRHASAEAAAELRAEQAVLDDLAGRVRTGKEER
ncbi:flagellar FliJ family protein [Naasia sp. SYSU D00057]|uniref:flagellar FliJ family protein n=1 Tax=Naasia sp. SYSU D00057 TaxID=2817380 RepID=UPI001B306AA0|nr:flagellar FliJ family protein [Naasia sp. SYSU D00057]